MSYHTYGGSAGGGGGASQVEVDALVDLSGRPALSEDLGSFTGTTIPDGETIKGALQDLESAIEAIPDALVYRGAWAASTNTPSLADGVGTSGDYYYVSDAGSVDFGSGSVSFDAGDRVVYEGVVWQKWETSVGVKSVNGDSGPAVVLGLGDLDDVNTSGISSGQTVVWNGTGFVAGDAGSVDSVNGQTGVVVLDASDIGNAPAGTISATTVQGAINELDGDAQAASSAASAAQSDIDDHIADPSSAHAASAISNTPSGSVSSTDVQGAINEIDGEMSALSSSISGVSSSLSDHISDPSGAHTASAISVSPSGGISSSDVQAALEELDSEKANTSSIPSDTDDLPEGATNLYYTDARAKAASLSVGTFSGDSITPTSALEQIFTYTGSSQQTFTGFGALSGIADGTLITVVGSSDSNPLSIGESDLTNGWLTGGSSFDLTRGKTISFRKNNTLGRMVLTGRSG